MSIKMVKEGERIIAQKEKVISELKQLKTFYHSIILATILGVLAGYIATFIFELIRNADFWTKVIVDGFVFLSFAVLLKLLYDKFKELNEQINNLIDSIEQDKDIVEFYKKEKLLKQP